MGDSAALRKARGAFFTPPLLCRYIAAWAIRSAEDRVLEPSCGDAEFLLAAGERLQGLGAARPRLVGVELHEASTAFAASRLEAHGIHGAELHHADFFEHHTEDRYDAVIGNPPYVRYQDFTGHSRARSRALALTHQVSLTGLASSWAAFTVHAASYVAEHGRLGLVLPAELLTVNYAASVRSFLLRRFARVRLVLFEERVFPGVLEEVVLLLAEGSGGTDHFELIQVRGVGDLVEHTTPTTWTPPAHGAKWLGALLSTSSADVYASATASARFTTLERWGSTTLGMVTGANAFFAMSPTEARRRRLDPDELLPISPPGSKHLRRLSITTTMLDRLGEEGAKTHLFRPSAPLAELSPGARRLIAEGERDGIADRYKCRVRTPWWRVPLVAKPDLLLTYMNDLAPQLATNQAQVHHLNSVHGVLLDVPLRALGRSLLPMAALGTVTLLGAELVGRSYGGGLLKLEPKEADQLPVPSPQLLAQRTGALRAARAKIAALLGTGALLDASCVVDEILFADVPELLVELDHLRAARGRLAARRRARGGSSS